MAGTSKKGTTKITAEQQKNQENSEQSMKLEESFSELENIITKLESDEISLKEAMVLYGKGAALAAACREELTDIEKEMIIITEHFETEEKE